MLTTQVQPARPSAALCSLGAARGVRAAAAGKGALLRYAGWMSASGGLQGRMRPSASFSFNCLVCGSFPSPLRHMERGSCGTVASALSWRWRGNLFSILAPEPVTRVCNGLGGGGTNSLANFPTPEVVKHIQDQIRMRFEKVATGVFCCSFDYFQGLGPLWRCLKLDCIKHRAPISEFAVGSALSRRSDRWSPDVSQPKFSHECTDSL